jgi:MtN3 and saliva related transmembrane protein
MLFIGIAGHFIFVFQTYKVLSLKSATDVSMEGFFIAFLSVISWLVYGYLRQDFVLIKVNIFGLFASSICIITMVLVKYGLLA